MKKIFSILIAVLLLVGIVGCSAADPVDLSVTELTTTTTPTTTQSQDSKLTADEARNIALQHAGVNLNEVSELEIEYDVFFGIARYSVEFQVGSWELDYEIHAETGEILKNDKERN